MHMYSDLAPWFHLLTHPDDYADEAGFVSRVVDDVCLGDARTLLELGSGGGNNASHLKARFECTLTDLSPEMLALSLTLNPECEHLEGDMRTLRLGRTFDVVFIHDAISYLTTVDDLRAAIETAAAHVRLGGVVILTPDATTEIFRPATDHGGHDGEDGRSLRYLEWTHVPEPGTSTYVTDYAIVARGPGEELRLVHDRHTLGLFSEETWKRLIAESGLELVDTTVENPYELEQAAFVAAAGGDRLTTSGRISTLLGEHMFVPRPLESPMLTTRQQEIWQFLAEYVDAHGYPPTVREIGEAVGLASPSTVHAHLANLERAGLLRRDPTKPRAIELVGRKGEEAPGRAAQVPTLPLLGRIAAGGPLLAEEAIEDEIAVPEPLGRDADFLLRVTGDSMVEAGILDGDIVVVRKQADARAGEIVVALVGDDESADEATVKTFHRERDGRIRLQPENAALEPLYPDHVEIIGKVTGVFRSLT